MAVGITQLAQSPNIFELTVNKNFVWLDKNNSDTVTVTTPSDGKIYVLSSANNVISATINANVITLKALKYGSAIITVSQDIGTGDYINKTPASKNIFVTNIDSMLENNSWEAISDVSQSGTGSNYWSIGDVKSITLNGNIGDYFTADNLNLNIFILHFNYPSHDKINNNIIFSGFKNNKLRDIFLNDSLVDNNDVYTKDIDGLRWSMNHWDNLSITGNNYGGWKGCDLRYDILGATSISPSDYGTMHTTACIGYNATQDTINNPISNTLMSILPNDFRSVLQLWDRYIDAKGNMSNTESGIEKTIDAITLLTEFEVFGTCIYSNSYEQNYQIQVDYYRLGKSQHRVSYNYDYQNNSNSHNFTWILASPCILDNYRYCVVYYGSNGVGMQAFWSTGIVPAFKV